jgi:hypothetical protein
MLTPALIWGNVNYRYNVVSTSLDLYFIFLLYYFFNKKKEGHLGSFHLKIGSGEFLLTKEKEKEK